MIFIYFLKSENQVAEVFKEFKALTENQSGKKTKRVRTDNGRGEYVNQHFANILMVAGIHPEIIVPHNPQQNCRAERANRIILDRARCLLFDAQLSKEFWAEAALMTCSISNCTHKKSLNDLTL